MVKSIKMSPTFIITTIRRDIFTAEHVKLIKIRKKNHLINFDSKTLQLL